MRKLGQALAAVGSLLALGSAYLHGFMARPVVIGRLPGDVTAATREAIHAAWLLGTAAMVAFALLVLAGLRSLGREPGAWRIPVTGGLFFLAFGAWAYVYRHGNPHYIGFMAIGLLWMLGAFLAARSRAEG